MHLSDGFLTGPVIHRLGRAIATPLRTCVVSYTHCDCKRSVEVMAETLKRGRRLGSEGHERTGRPNPDWFQLPVMRRIAITTPNVMAALRRLDRDQARPYNFAISPVLVNLSGSPLTLLGPFEKDSSKWFVRGVRSSNHDRSCDRRDAWVGPSFRT
jgi:hypothetical protein